MENKFIFEIVEISKSFGLTRALRRVSLRLNSGEVLGLIGDNGAGKSTLIKILSGFEKPDEGQIIMNGMPITFKNATEARAMGIETVYQEQALAEDLSVMENLFLGSEIHKKFGPFRILDKKQMALKAINMIELLRLRISPTQEVRFCSGGEKQGIAIARAINMEARLVILDEPTNALGVVAVDRVLDLIRELKRKGIACIFISHNISHVMEVADRVTMFVQGVKVLDVSRAETSTAELVKILNSRSGGKAVV